MKRTKSMVYNPSHESHELYLYAVNNGNLYRTMTQSIIASLSKKASKGTYDSEKAVDAWYRIATEAGKMYAKEHGSFGFKFDVTARFTAAVELEEYYREEILEV